MIHYAGFWIRFVANLIDTAILSLVTWGVGTMLFFFLDPKSLYAQMIVLTVYSVLSLFYFTLAHFKYGTTLGKNLFNIYVVSDRDQRRLSLPQSLLRALGYWVSWLPLGAGYIMVGFNPRKVGLHDMMARSISIRK